MGKYVLDDMVCSAEELLKFNISVIDEGIDNSIYFYSRPNMLRDTGRIEITFRGNNNQVVFGDRVKINRRVSINFLPNPNMPVDNCRVNIGNNTFFNGEVRFSCGEKDTHIYIGEDCLLANDVKFRTSDGHSVVDIASKKELNKGGDIHIGNRVWIGSEARFLKNAYVSDDSVVGMMSLVNKRFPNTNVCLEGAGKSNKEEYNVEYFLRLAG